jgi:hypothetical protein
MNTDAFMLEGRAYSWRRLCELRREQLEGIRKARGMQPPLFTLVDDYRPVSQQTGAGRYAEPSLFEAADCLRSRPP